MTIQVTKDLLEELLFDDEVWLQLKVETRPYKHDMTLVERTVKRLSDGKVFMHTYTHSYSNGIVEYGKTLRELKKFGMTTGEAIQAVLDGAYRVESTDGHRLFLKTDGSLGYVDPQTLSPWSSLSKDHAKLQWRVIEKPKSL